MKPVKYKLLLLLTVALIPGSILAGMVDYKPQVDISFGTFNYLFIKSDLKNLSEFKKPEQGVYLGGYISMISPMIKFFFDSSKCISIYELGIATNLIENSSSILITVPFSAAVGYPLKITKKLKIIPFSGIGFSLTYLDFENVLSPLHFYLLTGLEVRRKILKNSYFRIKCDVGILYSGRLDSSTFYFIRTRFPIPFLP